MRRLRSLIAPLAVGRDSSILTGADLPSVMDGRPDRVSKEAPVDERFEPTLVTEPLCPFGSVFVGGAKSSAVTPLLIC
jgi:hypothetical protein